MKKVLAFLVMAGLLAGCSGGSGGGGGETSPPPSQAEPDSQPPPPPEPPPPPPPEPTPSSVPAPQPTPIAPARTGPFAGNPEFYAPDPNSPNPDSARSLHWAPGAVKAHIAYQRLADRRPGELPGNDVRVAVIDTGIDLLHPEFDSLRTSEDFRTGDGDFSGDEFSHGTAVASLIGARRGGPGGDRDFHGVAWGATIRVTGIALGRADPSRPYVPISLPRLEDHSTDTASLLTHVLRGQGSSGSRPDVVNMSFGVSGLVEKYTADELRTHFRDAIEVAAQAAVPEAERALLVSSAGNANGGGTGRCSPDDPRVGGNCVDGELRASSPDVDSALMAHIPELRPHSVAVVSVGRDGQISDFSNRCGIAAKWCLAAPGEDMLAAYWGPPQGGGPPVRSYASGIGGTSFAAPVVSGGLAVVRHYFRGQLGNPEVLQRVLRTADVTPDRVPAGSRCPAHLDLDGDLSACELSSEVGRGLMNLDRATRPVGGSTTGTPGRTAPAAATWAATPAAWGDVGARVSGTEFAFFDSWNAPFWSDLGTRFAPLEAGGWTPPDPGEDAAAAGEALLTPHLAWSAAPAGSGSWLPGTRDWRFAFGPTANGEREAESFALSTRAAGSGTRFGLVYEGRSNQGAKPSGAFGDRASSSLVFVSRRHEAELGGGPLSLEASWTLGAGKADYPDSAMLQASGALYTAGEAALTHTGEDARTRLAVSQPLRAESGSGTLTYQVGRTLDGDWRYESKRFRLAPGAREVRLSLRHDRDLARAGAIAFEAGRRVDAGHVAGRGESFAGVGYRLPW